MQLRLPRKDALLALKFVSSVTSSYIKNPLLIYANKDKQECGFVCQNDDTYIRYYFPAEVQMSGVYAVPKEENLLNALTQTESAYYIVSMGKNSNVYRDAEFKQLIFRDLSDNTSVRILVEDIEESNNIKKFFSDISKKEEDFEDYSFSLDKKDFLRFSWFLNVVSNVKYSEEKCLHVFMNIPSTDKVIFYASDTIRLGVKKYPISISEEFFNSNSKHANYFSIYKDSFNSLVKSLNEIKKSDKVNFWINKSRKSICCKDNNFCIILNTTKTTPFNYQNVLNIKDSSNVRFACFKRDEIYDTVKRITEIVKEENTLFFFISKDLGLCSCSDDLFDGVSAYEFINVLSNSSEDAFYFCFGRQVLDILKTIDSEYVGFAIKDKENSFVFPVKDLANTLSLKDILSSDEVYVIAPILVDSVQLKEYIDNLLQNTKEDSKREEEILMRFLKI